MDIQKTGVKVFIAFLFLVLLSSVSAIEFKNGLAVDATYYDYAKKDQGIIINVRVYNSSSGNFISNSDADCYMDFYNFTGGLILSDQLVEPGTYDFKYFVAGGNLTDGNVYLNNIYCDDGNLGGTTTQKIYVNDIGKPNIYILITNIFMIIMISLFFAMVIKRFGDVDFEKADKKIIQSHTDNWMKTFAKSFIYGAMKNSFLWYYLGGWFLLFFVNDLMYRFGAAELYRYMVVLFDVYSIGFLLVIGVFIAMIIQHFNQIKEIIDDIIMGVN